MTRPSANQDQKMLNAGFRLLAKDGVNGLTVRNVCKEARVNLGMFNYYFKTKEKFIETLYLELQRKVEEFVDVDSVCNQSSIERLKHTLYKLAMYSNENRQLTTIMLFDGLVQFKKYQKYVENGVVPKFDFLVPLIRECKKDGYLKPDLPTIEIFALLFFGCLVPEMFVQQMKDLEKIHHLKTYGKRQEERLKERIDIVFKGVEG